MPLLVNRFTGSTVNVPEAKVDNLRGFGFDPLEDEKKSKATVKKTSSSKSEK